MNRGETARPAVTRATPADLPLLVPLFDAYRRFYGQAADPAAAAAFLQQRLQRGDSVLLLALDGDGEPAGFVQLYPSFSSVRIARTFILNDLFVVPSQRRRGVARQLLEAAEAQARELGAVSLSLSTAVDNHAAQRLYASAGWVRNTTFEVFRRAL